MFRGVARQRTPRNRPARIEPEMDEGAGSLGARVPDAGAAYALGAGTRSTPPGSAGAVRFSGHYRPGPGYEDRQRGAGAANELLFSPGAQSGRAQTGSRETGSQEGARYNRDQQSD